MCTFHEAKKHNPNAPIGSENTHWFIGTNWSNLQNILFRDFKNHCNDGGISSPIIIYYPNKTKEAAINYDITYILYFIST